MCSRALATAALGGNIYTFHSCLRSACTLKFCFKTLSAGCTDVHRILLSMQYSLTVSHECLASVSTHDFQRIMVVHVDVKEGPFLQCRSNFMKLKSGICLKVRQSNKRPREYLKTKVLLKKLLCLLDSNLP